MVCKDKCTHCGKQIGFNEFRFPDVHVSVKSVCFDFRYDADCLCEDCFKKMNAVIGMMVQEEAQDEEGVTGTAPRETA